MSRALIEQKRFERKPIDIFEQIYPLQMSEKSVFIALFWVGIFGGNT
jgi:hypothetical protein